MAVSVVVATIGWGFVAFAVMMLALLGVLVPRALGLRAAFDLLVVISVVVAGWSSVLGWYTSIVQWDTVVHTVLVGVLAALLYVIGERVGAVPQAGGRVRAVPVVLTLTFGLAIGAVWEMLEYLGHTYVDSTIFVGYRDTIGDLVADGAGALVCGFALPFLAAAQEVVPAREGEPRTLR